MQTRAAFNVLGSALLATLVATTAAGCRESTPPAGAPGGTARGPGGPPGGAGGRAPLPPVEVSLAPVVRRSVDDTIGITGTLFGEEEATIAAKVGGRVVDVKADLEDPVPSGTPLLQIDVTDYRLAIDERRSMLIASLAKLGLTDLPGPEFDVESIPPVRRARAEAANAQARLERAKVLFEQQPPLISEQDFEDIRTQAEVARQSASVEVLSAGATLAEARTQAATIAMAAQNMADTTVVSPFPPGGETIRYRVSERLVSLGELVTPGQPLYRLIATDVLKFRGQVPEQNMGRVERGQRAIIRVDAFKDGFEAKVTRVSPRIDERTRGFEVEIEVDNRDGRLKPGAFARAWLVVGVRDNVAFVPDGAVVTFAGVQKVFSVREGKAVEHRVRTGTAEGGMTEVDGIGEASQVVTRGAGALTGGRDVNVNAESATPATTAVTSSSGVANSATR